MIFSIIRIFSLSLFICATAFSQEFKHLGDIFKPADSLEKARGCIPGQKDGTYHFCNGLNLDQAHYSQLLKMDLEQCKKQIESFSHQIFYAAPDKNNADFQSFLNSTQRALVLHDKKMVFFKKDIRLVDCLHEMLHLLQRENCNNSALCPTARSNTSKQMLEALNQAVDQVADKEKKGQVDEAKRLSNLLSPYIKRYQSWENAINWLDEKDVHFFIYSHCDQLACTQEDREIALANLFKLREYFPPRFLSYIRDEASQVVEEKKRKLMDSLRLLHKKLEAADLLVMNDFIKQNIEGRFSILKNQGIQLFRLLTPIKSIAPASSLLPFESLKAIPVLSSTSPLFPNIRTKDFDGVTTACSAELKPVLLFGNKVSEVSLLREFYRSLVILRNPKLCTSYENELKLRQQFSTGKITREIFEDQLLQIMVSNDLILKDFATWLYRLGEERKEYLASLLFYSSSLLPKNSNRSNNGHNDSSIDIDTDSTLPRISVLGQPFVFDTGAMNSVISPNLFQYSYFQNAQWIKDITFNTADGRSIIAPYLKINHSIDIGNTKVSQLNIAVADLGFEGVYGIIGIDFMNQGNFIFDIKNKKLILGSDLTSTSLRLPLIPEYNGTYRALEFICPDQTVIRLDTGSEVMADYSNDLSHTVLPKINDGSWSCGGLKLPKKDTHLSSNSVLFSRDVKINLGWPWLKQYAKVRVSFSEGWISFEE